MFAVTNYNFLIRRIAQYIITKDNSVKLTICIGKVYYLIAAIKLFRNEKISIAGLGRIFGVDAIQARRKIAAYKDILIEKPDDYLDFLKFVFSDKEIQDKFVFKSTDELVNLIYNLTLAAHRLLLKDARTIKDEHTINE